MDMLGQLNAAVDYIEAGLCEGFDLESAAALACVTKDSFLRFFSYMAGMTLPEYVRCRRLTLAAQELRGGNAKVIDLALQYGWASADAFTRAFVRQHGITPTAARNPQAALKIYPPISFCIMVKGANAMDFRMLTLAETELRGVARQFDGQGYRTREDLRHLMWSEECEDVPGQLCAGRWNQAGSHDYDGLWYGIWQDGQYRIARASEEVKDTALEKTVIPAGQYAAFRTERGGRAWEEFPKLFELIFDSWLPSSPYRQKGDLIIEVLHLWTDSELRGKNRYYEVWLPVEEK